MFSYLEKIRNLLIHALKNVVVVKLQHGHENFSRNLRTCLDEEATCVSQPVDLALFVKYVRAMAGIRYASVDQ